MAGIAGVAAPRPIVHDAAWYLAASVEVNIVIQFLALHEALRGPMFWMADGQCLNADNPDAWFPQHGDHGINNSLTAKRVCRFCPVARQCFDYAMARPKITGIWGGTTERDRLAAHRIHDAHRKASA